MKRLLPRRIAAQLSLLVLGAVLLANALATALFFLSHDERAGQHPPEVTGRLAGVVEVISAAPAADRAALMAAFHRSHPAFNLTWGTGTALLEGREHGGRHLARALGPAFLVQSTAAPQGPKRLLHRIRLPDGSVLEAAEPRPTSNALFRPEFVSLLIGALCLGALLVWSGLRIVRPLEVVTRAAERFRPEARPAPLPETGPHEIQALARAFNHLQGRVSDLLTEKTNALAAVSHDLRTPITRMRLRAEFLPDTAERARMIHDLDIMDQMTQSALDHLRAVATGTDREPVDLASLLHTLADRFQDEGQDVRVRVGEKLIARVRPLDLERALQNLIENACKYATAPTLSLYRQAQDAVIEIEDRGPGIPAARRAELLQPFTRGDHARGMNETGGFGLGLAIARESAERQGGTLELADATPHGLLVRLRLPLA